jgi:hypothetical protein
VVATIDVLRLQKKKTVGKTSMCVIATLSRVGDCNLIASVIATL